MSARWRRFARVRRLCGFRGRCRDSHGHEGVEGVGIAALVPAGGAGELEVVGDEFFEGGVESGSGGDGPGGREVPPSVAIGPGAGAAFAVVPAVAFVEVFGFGLASRGLVFQVLERFSGCALDEVGFGVGVGGRGIGDGPGLFGGELAFSQGIGGVVEGAESAGRGEVVAGFAGRAALLVGQPFGGGGEAFALPGSSVGGSGGEEHPCGRGAALEFDELVEQARYE